MAKEKRCPQFQLPTYCLKEDCAWWDSLAKGCAILVIAKLGGCGSEGSYHNFQQEIAKKERGKIVR